MSMHRHRKGDVDGCAVFLCIQTGAGSTAPLGTSQLISPCLRIVQKSLPSLASPARGCYSTPASLTTLWMALEFRLPEARLRLMVSNLKA